MMRRATRSAFSIVPLPARATLQKSPMTHRVLKSYFFCAKTRRTLRFLPDSSKVAKVLKSCKHNGTASLLDTIQYKKVVIMSDSSKVPLYHRASPPVLNSRIYGQSGSCVCLLRLMISVATAAGSSSGRCQ